MPKNVTIKLSDETALWARRKAAEEDTSVVNPFEREASEFAW